MGTIPASENEFPLLRLAEVAAPSTPASGLMYVYAKSDGKLYTKNDAGTEVELGAAIASLAAHEADTTDAHDASAVSVLDTAAVFTATDVEAALKELYDSIVGAAGTMSTDPLWDAAGDLAVGTGANTAAKLTLGATNGMVLMRVGGAVAWALPSGHIFDYVQITSPVNVTATAEASATTVITGSAVTYDGSTDIWVEWFAPTIQHNSTGLTCSVYLYDGSSSIGLISLHVGSSTADRSPLFGARKLTPSNASHTYSIRATVNAASSDINCGAGGSGNYMPAFIRIRKA